MSTSRLSAWLKQRLGSGGPPAPAQDPGTECVELTRTAVAAVETAVCDAVCSDAALSTTDAPNVFGRSPAVLQPGDEAAVLDAALGLALAGQRTAAFVTGGTLPGLYNPLLGMVARRVPLVIHAELRSTGRGSWTQATTHEGYHALADAGAMLALAGDAQEAVDLTLAARRAAELALTPALVAMDALETSRSSQTVWMPGASLLRSVLGEASGEMESPTAAQRMLLGERRARVPRWFNVDRPLALGGRLSDAQTGAAMTAQDAFFTQHLPALVKQACDEVSRLTGRPLPMVRTHRQQGARCVVVAQGSLFGTACHVVDVARNRKAAVGAVGLTWLRPFPGAQLREALQGAQTVLVLERTLPVAGGNAPLTREVRAALQGTGARVTTVYTGVAGQPVSTGQLLELCINPPKEDVWAVPGLLDAASTFPKRQAALQAIQKEYPTLARATPSAAPLELPEGLRSVAWCARATHAEDRALAAVTNMLHGAVGGDVVARWTHAEVDGWTARITLGPKARDVDGAAVNLVLVDGPEALSATNPPVYRRGANVVVIGGASAQHIADVLPDGWKASVAKDAARLCWAKDVGALTRDVLQKLLEGADAGLPTVAGGATGRAAVRDAAVPAMLRQWKNVVPTVDNLPHHHGAVLQPLLQGERAPAVAEPWMAVDAVPAGAAALAARWSPGTRVPQLDAAKCTACGRCWAGCPDSAIGALALRPEVLLSGALDATGVKSPAVDKLKRSLKQVAQRVDAAITQAHARTLDGAVLKQALDEQLPKLALAAADETVVRGACEQALQRMEPALPLSTPDVLMHQRDGGKGGEALLWAVDVRSCQGCGGCAAVCPEGAIALAEMTPQRRAKEQARWNLWETLPDTTGETVARLSALLEPGPLGAALLSRHAQGAMQGGEPSTPGEGARLALRQVVAVTEQRIQHGMQAQAKALEELEERAQEKMRGVLAAGLPAQDLTALRDALETQPGQRVPLAQVLAAVERKPDAPQLDASLARRLVTGVMNVRAQRERQLHGVTGLGRARLAVVADAESTGQWLGAFPGSSVFGPVMLAPAGSAPSVALGLVRGVLDAAVEEYREVRRAELAVEAPANVMLAEQALDALTWRDLPAHVMDAVPPLWLVLRACAASHAAVTQVLAAGLPIKVLWLDPLDPVVGVDLPFTALAMRDVFVACVSVAHGAHLHRSVGAAMAYPGPAVVAVHVPTPAQQGFSADATVSNAQAAVEARLHPLWNYDPTRAGLYGARISLAGNADKDVPVDAWLKQRRLDAQEPQVQAWVKTRLERWTVLQELAGAVSPFTQRIQAQVTAETQAQYDAKAAALQAEHQARLEELERTFQARLATQLKAALTRLVAQSPRAGVIPDKSGGPS